MLEETVRRVEQALPLDHIFVLTNAAQIEALPRRRAASAARAVHRRAGQARHRARLRARHRAGARGSIPRRSSFSFPPMR